MARAGARAGAGASVEEAFTAVWSSIIRRPMLGIILAMRAEMRFLLVEILACSSSLFGGGAM